MSVYQEEIYMMPNYLIIILNRGKGNIFKCKVDIPEQFNSSNFEQTQKNNIFELIGVVSHFGESGMGGHFIAFCKHYLDNKWRCYNDSIVVECQNDYLTKGIPYILFYKNSSINTNQNINQNNMNFMNQPQHPIMNLNMHSANNLQPNMLMANNNMPQMNNMNMNLNLGSQNSFNNMNMNMMNNNMPQMNNMNMGKRGLKGSYNPNMNRNMNLNLNNQGSQNNFNNNNMNMNMMGNPNMMNNRQFMPNMMNMPTNM